MTEYIDSEKLKAKIEEWKEKINDHNFYLDNLEQALGYSLALDDISNFLDALKEPAKRTYKDCISCEYCIPRKDQIGWQFYGCFGGDYKGKYIAEIDVCPLKVAALQKQSCDTCTNDKGCVTCKDGELWEGKEVDLEAEMEKEIKEHYYDDQDVYWWNYLKKSFRHFYELGKNSK